MWDARPVDAVAYVLAASDIPAAPVLGLMAFGVVVAIVGHMGRNPRVVGVGVGALFLATALMMVLGYLAYNDDPGDPRDCNPEGGYEKFCR